MTRSFSAEDFAAITPRDLLLGATPADRLAVETGQGLEGLEDEELPQRVSEVEARVTAWWKKFSEDVFPLLAELPPHAGPNPCERPCSGCRA